MRWPWQQQPTPPDPQTLVRVAEQAANAAVERVEQQVARLLSATNSPNTPVADGRFPLYAYNNPWYFSTPQAPGRRLGTLISTDTLRQLADTYDIARSCIQHLKREVLSVPLKIACRDDAQTDSRAQERVKEAQAWFELNGGIGGYGKDRREFEAAALDDLLILGVAAVYYFPTRAGAFDRVKQGGVYEVVNVDAATIRPVVDAFGWSPDDRDAPEAPILVNGWRRRTHAPWEQWVLGTQVRDFTREELEYRGLPINARTYNPYPASPLEWLALTILTALKADEWNREWLTSGTSVDDKYAAPENWTLEQILQFTEHLNKISAGDSSARQQTKLFPSGTQKLGTGMRKDHDFEGLGLNLLRRTCAIYGVQPASIGFVGEQYKVTQEGSMDSTTQFGAGVLLDWRKGLYDDVLRRLGYEDLECRNVLQAEEDATKVAERSNLQIRSAQLTPNEARQAQGKDPIPGGDVLLVTQDLMPLQTLVAGVDPQTDPKDAEPEPEPEPGKVGSGEPPEGAKPVAADENPEDARPDADRSDRGYLARGAHRFSCVMAQVPAKEAQALRRWASEYLAPQDLAADGLEDTPHITCRYGLHTEEAAPVARVLAGLGPLSARIGRLSLFTSADYDVVKYEVESPDLHRLYAALGELEHTDTHPDYHPHLTVAYVQPGAGEKYVGDGPLTGQTLEFSEVVFSSKDGTTTTLSLLAHPQSAERGEALRLWQRKALKRLREDGRALCEFEHQALSRELSAAVGAELARCDTADAVRALFTRAEFDETRIVRDPKGRFAPKGVGDPSPLESTGGLESNSVLDAVLEPVSAPQYTHRQAAAEVEQIHNGLVDAKADNVGSSFSLFYGNLKGKPLWAVAPYKDRERPMSGARVTPQQIERYARSNQDLLARKDHFIGTWYNGEEDAVYLDISVAHATREAAERHGRATGQKAIYGLEKDEVVFL